MTPPPLKAMPNKNRTIIRRPKPRTAVWTGLVLMTSLVVSFGFLSVFLVYNHEWTDAQMARLPWPGASTSLAAERGLAEQMRVTNPFARMTNLRDNTPTLVAEATVVNDSMIPVSNMVLEAQAFAGDTLLRTASARCGTGVSGQLFAHMKAQDLDALKALRPSLPSIVASGAATQCQVAMAGLRGGADSVELRVTSVEPLAGHRSSLFRLQE